jgi:hypothetical protein
MNKNQYETITELISEHNEYVQTYGIGDSSFAAVFEDEAGDDFVLMQKVTMSPDLTEPRYRKHMVKVDKAGFASDMEERYFGQGGYVEHVKKLKRIKI